MPNHIEREALHYWTHVKRLRVTSGLATDAADTRDELDLIRSMSENPIIRRDISRALADSVALGRAQ